VCLTRANAAALLCAILIGGCASTEPDAGPGFATYVVRPDDTLYSIAWRHDLDYRNLAKWNNIGPDYKLAIGQVLLLHPPPNGRPRAAPKPVPAPRSAAARTGETPSVGPPIPLAPIGDARSDHAPGNATAVANEGDAGSGGTSASGPAPAGRAVPGGDAPKSSSLVPSAPMDEPESAAPAVTSNSKWVWPTDRTSAPRPVPGGGILLLGQLGQDVRAAGSGRVVYTGSGLRGYGNLIIIKHAGRLLSSYAHNRELLVHQGQEVAAGQVIAHMGTGPHQICALYFEIRLDGKPTDPLRYLSSAR
jgi:lipoprotein NlpD